MANYLTSAVNQFLSNDYSVVDLCCGNGNVSDGLFFQKITGVDIYEPYLSEYEKTVRNSNTILFDLSKIYNNYSIFKDKYFDTVICLDGVEHLFKEDAIKLINRIEEIATKKVVIFTPLNLGSPGEIVLNTPHNAWGINGGDSWQMHRSGFEPKFFQQKGYYCYKVGEHLNVYDNTPYAEMLYIKSF